MAPLFLLHNAHADASASAGDPTVFFPELSLSRSPTYTTCLVIGHLVFH